VGKEIGGQPAPLWMLVWGTHFGYKMTPGLEKRLFPGLVTLPAVNTLSAREPAVEMQQGRCCTHSLRVSYEHFSCSK